MTISIQQRFAKFLLLIAGINFLLFTDTTKAASPKQEISACGAALKSAIRGEFSSSTASKRCPLSAKMSTWLRLQKKDASFEEIATFLKQNPTWPRQSVLQKNAEKTINSQTSSHLILEVFEKFPPVTPEGATAYATALLQAGKSQQATTYIKQAWLSLPFETNEAKKFASKFKTHLTREDHRQRVSDLLDQEKVAAAQVMLPLLDKGYQSLAEARIALIRRLSDVPQKLSQLPKHLSTDVGLIYDQIKWHRKQDHDQTVVTLLSSNAPHNPELWWSERNILVRRLLDAKRYKDAYQLARNHSLSSGESFANAEWLAGWISLRFLNKPKRALKHFKKLHEAVKSPISIARASYWAGVAAQTLDREEESQAWFAKARAHPATYYGQLAYKQAKVSLPKISEKREVSPDTVKKFEDREFVNVIHLLAELKEKDLMEPFLYKLAADITDPAEQKLLIRLAAAKGNTYYGVEIAKKSTKTHAPLIREAYPMPAFCKIHMKYIAPAFAYAIIRQESRFKADAESPAGAKGLMQLMPATALRTAKKTTIPLGKLQDPSINIHLGCAHLKELLDKFGGSMVLAAAAYNAGATPVAKWIQDNGDPRDAKVDLVDWIEKIPYAETRNYVQRVLENHACYS